jgi:S-(hydroxymethyl)glutathione synthase
MTRLLHPSIQNGLSQGSDTFTGGVLVCKCQDRPVKVKISGGIAHTRLRLHEVLEA